MRRDNIFWGGALILLGALFLLQTQNIIPSVFPYIWPLGLILFGAMDDHLCLLEVWGH